MASNNSSSLAAKRYASALLDSAESQSKTSVVIKDLSAVVSLLQESEDFRLFTGSPLLSRQKQIGALREISKKYKFHQLTENFLCLLAKNRRLNMVSAIIQAVFAEESARKGEIVVQVQSAHKMTQAQEKELVKSLANTLGQSVAVEVSVKEDLIGGIVVIAGSQMIDDSVKRKLERLKMAMKSTANTNAAMTKAG